MTSLVAWVAADSRGPSSLNIATDSRITWPSSDGSILHWDHSKKVYACAKEPLLIGFVGDVLFSVLVIPGIIDRIDRGVFLPEGSIVDGVIAAIRRAWREYPRALYRSLHIYIAHRVGDEMSATFQLVVLSRKAGPTARWITREYVIPTISECLVIDGTGGPAIRKAIDKWQTSSAANTSRAVFWGFVDAIVSGADPKSGGAPQVGSLYRVDGGKLLGIIYNNQRYFGGAHLIGNEALDGVQWRNSLFERADGRKKSRLPEAQPQPQPLLPMSSKANTLNGVG